MQSDYRNIEDNTNSADITATHRPSWMNQNSSLSKWLLLWGSIIAFLVIVIIAGFFIKIPDVITFRAELKALRHVETVSFNTKAVFDTSLVSQGGNINKDEVIGAIATTAHHKSIFLLERLLATIDLKSSATATTAIRKLSENSISGFGELQADYDWLIGTTDTNVNQLVSINRLKSDLTWLKFSRIILEQQKKLLLKGEVTGSYLDINYQEESSEDPVADIKAGGKQSPVMDIFQYKELINKLKAEKVTIAKIDFAILANKLLYNTMNIRVEEMEAGRIGVVSAVKALQRRIVQWKQYCLLTSPINGQLEYAFTFDSLNSDEIKLPVARVKQAPTAYYFNAIAGREDYEQLHIGQDVKLTIQDPINGGFGVVDAVIDTIEPSNNKATSYNIKIAAKASVGASDINIISTNSEQEGLVANASVVTGYKNIWRHLWDWMEYSSTDNSNTFSWRQNK